MQVVIAVIKPNKLEAVKRALTEKGIVGMTAAECKGYAKQMGHTEKYRGPKMDAGFVPKVMIFVAVTNEHKQVAIDTIVEKTRTGTVGDGKIFVVPLSEVLRIRTGELNEAAI
ncbi:P-II family nitrogen regulator [soil metagenome]